MVHLSTAQQATKHTRCFRAIGRILEQDAATKIATVKIAGKLCTGRWVKTSIIVIKTNLTLIIRVKLFRIRLACPHRRLGNIDERITRWQKRHGAK